MPVRHAKLFPIEKKNIGIWAFPGLLQVVLSLGWNMYSPAL
jgi:hypothetical protein